MAGEMAFVARSRGNSLASTETQLPLASWQQVAQEGPSRASAVAQVAARVAMNRGGAPGLSPTPSERLVPDENIEAAVPTRQPPSPLSTTYGIADIAVEPAADAGPSRYRTISESTVPSCPKGSIYESTSSGSTQDPDLRLGPLSAQRVSFEAFRLDKFLEDSMANAAPVQRSEDKVVEIDSSMLANATPVQRSEDKIVEIDSSMLEVISMPHSNEKDAEPSDDAPPPVLRQELPTSYDASRSIEQDLIEQLQRQQDLIAELSPQLGKRLDDATTQMSSDLRKVEDGLASLQHSVELHDGAIYDLPPYLRKHTDDGLATLRHEFQDELAQLQQQLWEVQQSPAKADLKTETIELVEQETSSLSQTFEALLEKRIATVITKGVDLERQVADLSSRICKQDASHLSGHGSESPQSAVQARHRSSEPDLNMHRHSDQSEVIWKQCEDAFQQEVLAMRQQFEQHRAISERVEALAATALNATQRELDKHQAALVTLADFTDSAMKDLNSKCEALRNRDITAAGEVTSLEVVCQAQHEQQSTLDILFGQVQWLKGRIAGLTTRIEEPAEQRQDQMCKSLERSQEQMEASEPSRSRALPTPEVEKILGDINGRIGIQQQVQEELQREISSLRVALDGSTLQQHVQVQEDLQRQISILCEALDASAKSQASLLESGFEAFGQAGEHIQAGLQGVRAEVEAFRPTAKVDSLRPGASARSAMRSPEPHQRSSKSARSPSPGAAQGPPQAARAPTSPLEVKVDRMVGRVASLEHVLSQKFSAVLTEARFLRGCGTEAVATGSQINRHGAEAR